MHQLSFTKPEDAVRLVLTVLKRLNAYDLSSMDARIKCQKIQYLAQSSGVSPAYSFNLYLRGPYSPDLTKDLFAAKEYVTTIDSSIFASNELENRFQKLKTFINSKSTRELELVSTLNWLIYDAKLRHEDALKKLKDLKSASIDELEKTSNLLKEFVK